MLLLCPTICPVVVAIGLIPQISKTIYWFDFAQQFSFLVFFSNLAF